MAESLSLRGENPAETAIFAACGASGHVDEKGPLAYKPAELSAMTRPAAGSGSFGAERVQFGPHLYGRIHQFYRQIARSAEKNP
ncbi:hypothetical protein C2U70_20700 [Bradyrhizobium guangdongense]|nr:hypothetical protein C2U70_20700 [Bradyrhizobium guangdongense]